MRLPLIVFITATSGLSISFVSIQTFFCQHSNPPKGFLRLTLQPKRKLKTMNVKQILIFTFMFLTVGAVHAQDYELVWSDEFDTNTLGTNWNVEVTDAPYNNSLHMVSFTHGKIEARIKLPHLANGLWPAFWMMGEDFDTVNWPKCGEIDIMEMGMKNAINANTTDNTVAGTIHWGESIAKHQQFSSGDKTVSQNLTDGYHIFTCEWDDDYLKFYIDNDATPYFTATIKKGFSRSAYFHKPYFLIFNLAVGGDFTGITHPDDITALPQDGSEAKMLIDYVRIYQKKGRHNVSTGIREVRQKTSANNDAWYNITGQRVTSDSRGLLIHQGKKIIRQIQ